jgi:large subunit ribosomal protein LX
VEQDLEVKTYVVSGFFTKGSFRQRFSTQACGIKKEEAIEKVLSEIGGRFKVKRTKVNIEKVEETKPEK